VDARVKHAHDEVKELSLDLELAVDLDRDAVRQFRHANGGARMLAGAEITEEARRAAERLMRAAG